VHDQQACRAQRTTTVSSSCTDQHMSMCARAEAHGETVRFLGRRRHVCAAANRKHGDLGPAGTGTAALVTRGRMICFRGRILTRPDSQLRYVCVGDDDGGPRRLGGAGRSPSIPRDANLRVVFPSRRSNRHMRQCAIKRALFVHAAESSYDAAHHGDAIIHAGEQEQERKKSQ
jgi:hypothetical protein